MVNYISNNRRKIINGLLFILKFIYAVGVVSIGFVLGIIFILFNNKEK